MRAIEIDNLSVSYKNITALWSINLNIEAAQIVGIIGPNGSGKSTLIKSMIEIIPRDSGKILFFGSLTPKQAQPKIAYVPQREEVDWDFPISVLDVVMMGLDVRVPFYKALSTKDKEFCLDSMKKVGLSAELAHTHIGELSGGQQQRVFIARALVQKADVYILDEPFASIDAASEKIILNIFKELKASGKTMVIVHHDLFTVQEHFDSVALLNNRLVAYGKTADVLTAENLALAYAAHSSPLIDALKRIQASK
jgi:manganese/zinc/iron transport system ATP- binding protein